MCAWLLVFSCIDQMYAAERVPRLLTWLNHLYSRLMCAYNQRWLYTHMDQRYKWFDSLSSGGQLSHVETELYLEAIYLKHSTILALSTNMYAHTKIRCACMHVCMYACMHVCIWTMAHTHLNLVGKECKAHYQHLLCNDLSCKERMARQ